MTSPGATAPGWLFAALTTEVTAGAPGGVTVRVTAIAWLPPGMFGELTVIVPVYVPGASVDTTDWFSATDRGAGVFPDAGVTVRKAPPVIGANDVVKGTFPPVLVNGRD